MENHMGARVRQRREELKLTQKQLADAVGCSQPMIKKIEAGSRTSLGRKLAQALGTTLEWLETGQAGPAPALQQAQTGSSFDENVSVAAIGQREVPVINYVQAGRMTEVIDPLILGASFDRLLTDVDVSASAFALVIKGESMLPEFQPGDKVVIDPGVAPQPGDYVAAKNSNEEATFKKYRPRGTNDRGDVVFELVPLNEDFPTLHSERDHLRVIGVMVEHRKYRRRRLDV